MILELNCDEEKMLYCVNLDRRWQWCNVWITRRCGAAFEETKTWNQDSVHPTSGILELACYSIFRREKIHFCIAQAVIKLWCKGKPQESFFFFCSTTLAAAGVAGCILLSLLIVVSNLWTLCECLCGFALTLWVYFLQLLFLFLPFSSASSAR